jgi:predicted nucleotidyltransferase component of viral defense system
MHDAIQTMLQRYNSSSLQEHDQALREILQEVALVGLWRGKFFEHAAFYGGTALRIFYGLDRFSEDLDFTLLKPNANWNWQPFSEAIKRELASFGFDVSFIEKEKANKSAIKSAFLKTSTTEELIKIGVHSNMLRGLHPETIIRIKVEIDTEPPLTYSCEQKFLSQPLPVSIKCVSEKELFACKVFAAFFRTWKNRVKGRDWFDLVWFIRRQIPLDLAFYSKLSGSSKILSPSEFIEIAHTRINQVDIAAAIKDIINFVRDQEVIERSWSKEYFLHWIQHIKFI